MKIDNAKISGVVASSVRSGNSQNGVYYSTFKIALNGDEEMEQLVKVICYGKLAISARYLPKGQSVILLDCFLKQDVTYEVEENVGARIADYMLVPTSLLLGKLSNDLDVLYEPGY